MNFRVGEDVKIYFPVTDQVTGDPIDVTGAAAQWVCGTLVGNVFTPALTIHTTDQTNPITLVSNPNTPSDHTTDTFLVRLTSTITGGLLGTYYHEIAMELSNFRIVIYPPIAGMTTATFTVYPSWSWDAAHNTERIAVLDSQLPIEKEEAKSVVLQGATAKRLWGNTE